MVRSDGTFWLLVFSKELKQEGFIPCEIDLDERKITKGDRTKFILSSTLIEYAEAKKVNQDLGFQMSSI